MAVMHVVISCLFGHTHDQNCVLMLHRLRNAVLLWASVIFVFLNNLINHGLFACLMKPKSSCLCTTVAYTFSVHVHVCVCCVVHTDHTTSKIPHIQTCAAGWREWKAFSVYCCSFARETPASWPAKRKHDRYGLERSTTSFLPPSFLLLPSPPLLILSFLRIA